MHAHHAVPAPPHSLPHLAGAINNTHTPPHHHSAPSHTTPSYTYSTGSPYSSSATVPAYRYGTPEQMQPYSQPNTPYGQPGSTTPSRGWNSPGFNDFGVPRANVPQSSPSHAPRPSATVGGIPSRGSPAPFPPGYQGFHGFMPQTPVTPPVSVRSGPEAIPSPVRRTDYQAPQFKTFAERKREREAELRRQAAEAAAAITPPAPLYPNVQAPRPDVPTKAPARYDNASPSRPVSSSFANGPRTPSASALRLMGTPTGGSGARPLPPPRSTSGPAPPSPSPGGRALPTPRGASGPGPSPSSQPWVGVATPPVPAIPSQHLVHSPSPAPPPRSVSPAPPMRSVSPAPPARSVSPAPPVNSMSGTRSSSQAPPNLQHKPVAGLPGGVPHNAAVQALLDRSDTVSSVRSVDRGGFGPKRVLPQPPVGVKTSLSLDRGSSPSRPVAPLPNRGPSPVAEERDSEIAVRMASMNLGSGPPAPPVRSRSPNNRSPSPTKRGTVPSIVPGPPPRPGRIRPVIAIENPAAPAIVVGGNSPPTPTITVGTPPTPTIAVCPPLISVDTPSSPGFSFSGLPTIEVSTSHTTHEQVAGPLSIAVPSINVGGGDTPAPRSSPRSAGPTRLQPECAIMCAGCDEPIIGRIVSAIGQRWHPQCFKCDLCRGPLEHVSSYAHEGKPHCHLCYHDRFAHKCYHCHTAIVDPRFITLNDEVLGQRYYHELHFFCSECGDPFLDPSKSSAAGTEIGGYNDEDGETNAFVIHKGHPYCERCHLRLHKPKCRACKNPIPDIAVTAMGAKWHQECFVCANCTSPFANNIFFPRADKAFCTECFEKMTDL